MLIVHLPALAIRPIHLLVLLIVLLLLFGSARLPQVISNLGKSAKVLKREIRELNEEESTNSDNSTANNTPMNCAAKATTPNMDINSSTSKDL